MNARHCGGVATIRAAAGRVGVLLACAGVLVLCTLGRRECQHDQGQVLFDAAKRGDLAAVERAVKGGAPVDLAESGSGWTPLMYAVRHGRLAVAGWLLDRGADPRAVAGAHGTPLAGAASAGQRDAVRLLLARGADPNRRNPHGYSPLMCAAGTGDVAVVELLIGVAADVGARDCRGNTALMVAAAAGRDAVVARLLSAGADPLARDENGVDAAGAAELLGHAGTARLLRLHTPPPPDPNRDGPAPPMLIAVAPGGDSGPPAAVR